MPAEPRIDACIAAAPPFSRPILEHLRALVHSGCGEATEAIKWGRPFFLLDGRPLAMMAAFKAHAAFGFWGKGEGPAVPDGAGDYGRLTALADLPDDETLRMAIAAAAARVRSRRSSAPPGGTATPAGPAGRSCRRACRACRRRGALAVVSAQPPARLCRVGRGGETRRHARAACGAGGRTDRAWRIAQRQVRTAARLNRPQRVRT